jgi:HNH endonuclease
MDWEQLQYQAAKKVKELAAEMAEEARLIWERGDGQGGYVYQIIVNEFIKSGLAGAISNRDLSAASSPKSRGRLLRQEVLERDGYRCMVCGDWHSLVIDHIYPISKGGLSIPDNLQVLCATCNSKKGARIEDKSQ